MSRVYWLFFALFSLSSLPSQAQVPTSIAGTVQDATGGVVVGATLTLTDEKGAIVQSVATSETGEYIFAGLTPGTYTVTATAPGFNDFKLPSLSVVAGQALRQDLTLITSTVVTQTTVEGQSGANVETEQSQISGTITQKELIKLGLNGRNFTQLIALAPGVSNQTGQDEAKVGIQGSVKYSVNGGRVEYNNFDVDGQDVLNAGINGSQSTLIVYPSLDALSEVQVLTSNYGAQYGKTASGTILSTIKSGGPEFHGDAYYFNRNELFNARNFFDQTRRAPLYRKNDVGFTVGGQMLIPGLADNNDKQKTFFFWSEEWRIEEDPTGYTYNRAVPSLQERAGVFNDVCPDPSLGIINFSRNKFPDCPSQGVSGRDPVTGDPLFQTNLGNAITIDPVAQGILDAKLIPVPNATSGCNSPISSCFDATVSPDTHWRQDLFRIDHDFNTNSRLSLRFIHDSWDTTVPVPQWAYLTNSFPTVQNDFNGPGIAVMTRWSQTISNTLLNQVAFGYTTDHISLTDIPGYGGSSVVRTAAFAGMGTLFPTDFGNKIPSIALRGTNAEYGGAGFYVDTGYMPWHHSNPTYTIREDMTKVWGKHTFQFGALFLIAQRNEINPPVGSVTGDVQGIANFSNVNNTGTTGNVFADFLQGSMNSFQQDSAQHKYYQRYKIAEPYLQDDWHVTQRLTLNLGLRLSLFGNYREKYNNVYNWDPSKFDPSLAATIFVNPFFGNLIDKATNQPLVLDLNNLDPRITNGLVQCGKNGVPSSCIDSHIFNPEPRIGFAFSPFKTGKTSIRGGYGIFYEHGTGGEANTGSLEGSSPLVLSATQIYPFPYSGIGSSSALNSNLVFPVNVTSIPRNTPFPYVQQWSFGLQQEFPHQFIFGVGYVGSKGTHLTALLQLNQLPPVPKSLNPFNKNQPITFQTCGAFDSSQPDSEGYQQNTNTFHINGAVIGAGDPAYANLIAACSGHSQSFPASITFPLTSTLPTFAPNVGNIYSLQNVANSNYHALQTTMRKVAGPLTLSLSYTYSHSLDDSSDRTDATFVNSLDLAGNHASSDFDQRNLLAISYIYKLPVLRVFSALTSWTDDPTNELSSKSPASASSAPGSFSSGAHKFWDGWELSGVIVHQTGTPFTIINAGSPNGISVPDTAGVVNNIGAGSYPDIAGNPYAKPPAGGENSKSFGPLLGNPTAFAAPQGLTFGTAGRNFFNNPSRTNFDTSLLKTFSWGESRSFEFRIETFNTFNHTQFRIYNPDRGNLNNTIGCYGGPDNLAGFVGGGTDCLTGSSFLHPIDAHRPRTMQLGIKLNF